MYKLNKPPQSMTISPKEAEALLKFNTFPGQRKIREQTVAQYRDKIKLGLMRPCSVSMATLSDGSTVLMNGQQSLSAICLAEMPHAIILEEYSCETGADAWRLYASYDVGRMRTMDDVFKGAQGLLSDVRLRQMPLRLLTTCGCALLAIKGPRTSFETRLTGDKSARVDIVNSHAEEVSWVSSFGDKTWMQTTGVVAAMIKTHRANPEKAEVFWEIVYSGVGIETEQDPAAMLKEELMSNSRKGMHARGRIGFEYAKSISWWNAWIKGVPRKSVKYAAMKLFPEALS